MGKETGIAWTDSTWNPVVGCTKISEGCASCYAAAHANRYGLEVWGANPRQVTTEQTWGKLKTWNDEIAKSKGSLRKVFFSMCDPFEDQPQWNELRPRFLEHLEKFPNLIFQFLTKRPENIERMLNACGRADWFLHPQRWIGTSVELQKYLAPRVDALTDVPAEVKFLSLEPLLEGIDLRASGGLDVDWIIVGGESGHGARSTQFSWFARIIADCKDAGVPVFMKQFGKVEGKTFVHPKGGDPAEWPAEFRVQQFPKVSGLVGSRDGRYYHRNPKSYKT